MMSALSTSIVIRNMLLLLLTCTAGYLDTISYRGLERVFTANMTGNTVLLGLALVEADSQAALRSGLVLKPGRSALSGPVRAAFHPQG